MPYAQDVYGCLLNNGMYMSSSLIVKWIYLLLRLHWVATTPQFDSVYISKVPQVAFMSISVSERSLLALDFISTFYHRNTSELPPLKTLCWTAMWFLVPSVKSVRFRPESNSMAVAIADQESTSWY